MGSVDTWVTYIVAPLTNLYADLRVDGEAVAAAEAQWAVASTELQAAADGLLMFALTLFDDQGRPQFGVATGFAFADEAYGLNLWYEAAGKAAAVPDDALGGLRVGQGGVRDQVEAQHHAQAAKAASYLIEVLGTPAPDTQAHLTLVAETLRKRAEDSAQAARELVVGHQIETADALNALSDAVPPVKSGVK